MVVPDDSSRPESPVEPVEPRAAASGPPVLAIALTAVALAGFLALVVRFAWVCDDAFISFRYAKNLAAGHGLVWNIAESPRVEGFSNLLWVLLISLFERVGANVQGAVPIASALAGGLLVLLTARAVGLRDTQLGLAGALAVVAASPALAVWSTSGLATAPFALFFFAMWCALMRRDKAPNALRAVLFSALACGMRADGPGFVLPLLAALAIGGRLTGDRRLARASALALGSTLLVVAGLTAWRLAYYGDWLPNTARAKVALSALTLERGWNYLAVNALTTLSLPLAWLIGWFGGLNLRQLSALGVAAGFALYAVLAGGDFMPFGRLLVPALPFVAVAAAAGIGHIACWDRLGPLPYLLASALPLALVALSLPAGWNRHLAPEPMRSAFHFRWNTENFQSEYDQWFMALQQSARWRALGRQLAAHTEPEASFIMGTIGAAGYFSERTIYDTFGLTNRLGEGHPRRRRSPGHDRAVPVQKLVALNPTYLNANLVPKSKPDLYLPGFLRPGQPLYQHAEFELLPTSLRTTGRARVSDPDLPDDALLRLVRYRP